MSVFHSCFTDKEQIFYQSLYQNHFNAMCEFHLKSPGKGTISRGHNKLCKIMMGCNSGYAFKNIPCAFTFGYLLTLCLVWHRSGY